MIIRGREWNVKGEAARLYNRGHRLYDAHRIARIIWFPAFFLGLGLRWTLDGSYGLASIWLLSVGVSVIASALWIAAKVYFWRADKEYRRTMMR